MYAIPFSFFILAMVLAQRYENSLWELLPSFHNLDPKD